MLRLEDQKRLQVNENNSLVGQKVMSIRTFLLISLCRGPLRGRGANLRDDAEAADAHGPPAHGEGGDGRKVQKKRNGKALFS